MSKPESKKHKLEGGEMTENTSRNCVIKSLGPYGTKSKKINKQKLDKITSNHLHKQAALQSPREAVSALSLKFSREDDNSASSSNPWGNAQNFFQNKETSLYKSPTSCGEKC